MKQVVMLLTTLVLATAWIGAAIQHEGAESMVLEGGSLGKVPFPHHRHQDALEGDCSVCHDQFPQEKGSIEKLKEEGKLERRDVMNQCQSCHRKKARAGEKAGPVRCNDCHSK